MKGNQAAGQSSEKRLSPRPRRCFKRRRGHRATAVNKVQEQRRRNGRARNNFRREPESVPPEAVLRRAEQQSPGADPTDDPNARKGPETREREGARQSQRLTRPPRSRWRVYRREAKATAGRDGPQATYRQQNPQGQRSQTASSSVS